MDSRRTGPDRFEHQLEFFSLEEINLTEGKKHPWEREWSYGWSMMRIGALLRRSSMDDLDRWYERDWVSINRGKVVTFDT